MIFPGPAPTQGAGPENEAGMRNTIIESYHRSIAVLELSSGPLCGLPTYLI